MAMFYTVKNIAEGVTVGRPPKPADAKRTERFSLYLTPDEAEKVKREADEAGVSLNQLLAWIVGAGLATLGVVAISELIKQSKRGGGSN
jgi:hypothetical protein